jgi:hypothetical protein
LLLYWGLFWCSEHRIWSSSWCRRSHFRICWRNYKILRMNKLVLIILAIEATCTMTQKLFLQGIMNVFSRSQDLTTQSTRARSWFFHSTVFCKKCREEKIMIKLRSLQPIKCSQPYCYRSEASNWFFYEAEDYHQDYVKHNPNQPYVKGVSGTEIQQV